MTIRNERELTPLDSSLSSEEKAEEFDAQFEETLERAKEIDNSAVGQYRRGKRPGRE